MNIIGAIVLAVLGTQPIVNVPLPDHRESPLQVAAGLFDALSSGDEPFLALHSDPAGTVTVLFVRDDGTVIRRGSLAQFVEVDKAAAKFEERLYDAREISGPEFATVLGRYRYSEAGEIRHCGAMLVAMRSQGTSWVVEHLQYTVETNCPR